MLEKTPVFFLKILRDHYVQHYIWNTITKCTQLPYDVSSMNIKVRLCVYVAEPLPF